MFIDDLVEGTAMDGHIHIHLPDEIRDEYVFYDEGIRSYIYAIPDLFSDKIYVIHYGGIIECYVALRPFASGILYKAFPIFVRADIGESPVSAIEYVFEVVFLFPVGGNDSEIYLFRPCIYNLYSREEVFYRYQHFHNS